MFRIVDGQQGLTTVSILLACIAAKLGSEVQCGDWTARIILDDRLTNPEKTPEKFRKLRLQDGDNEEYRLGPRRRVHRQSSCRKRIQIRPHNPD